MILLSYLLEAKPQEKHQESLLANHEARTADREVKTAVRRGLTIRFAPKVVRWILDHEVGTKDSEVGRRQYGEDLREHRRL